MKSCLAGCCEDAGGTGDGRSFDRWGYGVLWMVLLVFGVHGVGVGHVGKVSWLSKIGVKIGDQDGRMVNGTPERGESQDADEGVGLAGCGDQLIYLVAGSQWLHFSRSSSPKLKGGSNLKLK